MVILWRKVVTRDKLLVIRYINTRDIMYDMIHIINSALC